MNMNPPGKLTTLAGAAKLCEVLRRQGKTVVQSHGTFEFLHPGAVLHLEEARALGDVLVVTVSSGQSAFAEPAPPQSSEVLRARALAALTCVDHVVLVPESGAAEAIRAIRPHVFCKGKEYEPPSGTLAGAWDEEREAVAAVGGQVRFVGSVVFTWPQPAADTASAPLREFCRSVASRLSPEGIDTTLDRLARLRVLVVGDTIFDRYSYVRVQGLTSKNRIISGRFLREETQCGGALAVFRHVRQFTEHARFLSLVGEEPWVAQLLQDQVARDMDLVVRDPRFTTVVKQRFVEPLSEDKELSKLFAVNYLDADPPAPETSEKLRQVLARELKACDVVLVADFGHGFYTPAIRSLVQEAAPFLALNCQTNSNNHGFNIISRQYERADAFSLDEQELLLACGRRGIKFEAELHALQKQLKARFAWLTRGAIETLGLKTGETPTRCPPLETDITDTVGAGDAFFSVASLAAACDLPIELATFLGQLAGAQAVRVVGNARPISRAALLEDGRSMLSFQ